MTTIDGKRLPLVLERSGSMALDVKLLWQRRFEQPVLTQFERMVVAKSLANCRERVQHLFIDVSHIQPQTFPLHSLLGVGLSCPMLEDLEYQTSHFLKIKCHLSFSAPRMKHLDLQRQGARKWLRLPFPLADAFVFEKVFYCGSIPA